MTDISGITFSVWGKVWKLDAELNLRIDVETGSENDLTFVISDEKQTELFLIGKEELDRLYLAINTFLTSSCVKED